MQEGAIVDSANQQAGISVGRFHGATRNHLIRKVNGPDRKLTICNRIRQQAHVSRSISGNPEALSRTREGIGCAQRKRTRNGSEQRAGDTGS